MKRSDFTIKINAPREKVWEVLWNDSTYREWTKVFSEGSRAVSDWKEGSKVQFLSETGEGMFSKIAKKVPNEFMSFTHLGVMKDGKELPIDKETEKWSGAQENYTLKEAGGLTELKVELDTVDDYQEYFNETFPKALAKVKDLAES